MRKFYLILFAAAALVAAACEKNPAVDPTPVTPTESTTDPVMATLTDSQINGTSIGADMTVAGLVKNVKTGQGIAGVNVTDGYGWARTDANGVYQMKANDLARKIYITTPAAFKIGQSSDGHPNFFTKKNIERGKKYVSPCFLFAVSKVLMGLFPFVRDIYWKLEYGKLVRYEKKQAKKEK